MQRFELPNRFRSIGSLAHYFYAVSDTQQCH
jgi:hypothetical protein